MNALTLPGEVLGDSKAFLPGSGTYMRGDQICASIAGLKTETKDEGSGKVVISVKRAATETTAAAAAPPQVGNIVTARITRITQMAAHCDILVVEGLAASEPYSGIVRRENVRDSHIDIIVMSDMFRPNDLIVAEVASLGDARSYFLSTSKDSLGVVFARGENSGEVMRAVSKDTMECVRTEKKEKRKVANLEGSALGGGAGAQ